MFRPVRLPLLLATASLIASCGKSPVTSSSSPAPSAESQPGASSTSVVLRWNPVTEPNLSYRVYYGTASRSYLQPHGHGLPSATNTYTVAGLTGPARYFFSVTTADSRGNESGLSGEAFVDVP